MRGGRPSEAAQAATGVREPAGLPPDSIRYRYRALYQQPLFTPYARPCPNAEQLATATIQLPVHPGLSQPALEWIAGRVATIAQRESESQ